MASTEELKERLNLVNEAIDHVLVGGQKYRIGTRELERANLSKLYEMQADLRAQIAERPVGLLDDCYVAVFDSR